MTDLMHYVMNCNYSIIQTVDYLTEEWTQDELDTYNAWVSQS